MAEGKCVGCENITKYLCLKCNALVCNRSLKCSVPASENYCGWKEWTKVVLCFKCDKEEHAIKVKTPLSTARIIRFSKRGGAEGGGGLGRFSDFTWRWVGKKGGDFLQE